MEEEKKEADAAKEAQIQEKLAQYLAILFRYAGWIPASCRSVAEGVTGPELLNEIYLCVCEGVSADKITQAKASRYPEAALKILRRGHVAGDILSEKQMAEISELKKRVAVAEKKNQELNQRLLLLGKQTKGPGEKKEDAPPKPQTPAQQEENPRIVVVREPKPSRRFSFGKPKQSVSAFLHTLLEDGAYSREQMEYLLDCIEEGISLEVLREIASPKLPVEVMRRLLAMKRQEESKKKGKDADGTG